MKTRHIVLAIALVNAFLYCCLLPLWNGFDEPFHYSYVETLVVSHSLPVLQHTPVTAEISVSLTLTPLSHLLSSSIPGSRSIEQWALLPPPEKRGIRATLERLPTRLRLQNSGLLNYESQQAPLTYLLFAPLDALFAGLALPKRILLLRLIGSVASALLLYFSVSRLLAVLDLRAELRLPLLLCVFLSQMLWASVAHIGNDTLAIPLTVLFLAWLARVVQLRQSQDLLILAAILAAGLITKAHFLSFIPVFLALLLVTPFRRHHARIAAASMCLLLVAAGPWYLRNLLVYGSLSGTQESVSGIGWEQALAAVPRIPWRSSAGAFARWSLWTGDWSFVSFSRITLNVEIGLLLAAFAIYACRFRRIGSSERWLIVACALFLAGLAYQTCVTFAGTHGESKFPEPWYGQGVWICLWVLAFKGLERGGLIGRVVAVLLTLLSAWIAMGTYFWKLTLFYGTGMSRSTLRNVLSFWGNHPSQNLSSIILGPLPLFYSALVLFALLLLAGLATYLTKTAPLQ